VTFGEFKEMFDHLPDDTEIVGYTDRCSGTDGFATSSDHIQEGISRGERVIFVDFYGQ
jgi:hypothetical protein